MKIPIGQTAEGKSVAFDLETLVVTRLLIQANSGAGKSYLLRKLMEELFGHIQIVCIDPEGEFATLREKFGFVLVGKGGETPADVRTAATVAEKLLELKASAICDLYEMKSHDRHLWVKTFLDAMINAPKKLWHPAMVIVDEAHIFCPEKGAGDSEAKESMIDLTTRGRKRGFCAVWATQRLAKVDKDATSGLLNRLVGGTFEDVDIKRALDLLSIPPELKQEVSQQLRTMDPGFFYAFGRAVAKERVLFKTGKVETSHPQPGSAKHAAEPPPPPEKVQALLPKLADLPKLAEEKAQTVADLKAKIRSLHGELIEARKTGVAKPSFNEVDVRIAATQARDEEWELAFGDFRDTMMERVRTPVNQLLRVMDVILNSPTPAPRRKFNRAPVPTLPSLPSLPQKISSLVSASEESKPMARSASPAPSSEMNGEVSRPQMRILEALAVFEAIGRSPVSKKWTAALSEVSHASSSYTNNLGALRTRGLIDYPSPGMVSLTQAGREVAPAIDAPTSTEELLERCKKIVSAPQWEILQVLTKSYPDVYAKEKLAEEVGVSPASSSYTNNLGALRSAGMIDYPAQGTAKAADWLFLE